MGYSTSFKNSFVLDKPLDDETFNFLKKLATTRRMGRNLPAKYGVQGEFFVDGKGSWGQDNTPDVINGNQPPVSQPGLWCQWIPNEERDEIKWDGGEKFYHYIEWIEYIISKVLAPRGYVLNGTVKWRGEDFDDTGEIEVVDNMVNGKRLIVDYSINNLLGAVTSGKKDQQPQVVINQGRKVGFTPEGKKTKHQKAKEKHEAEMRALEAKIAQLEEQVKEKDKLLKREQGLNNEAKKLTVQDLMLEKIRKGAAFGGTLDDFKAVLKNLLEG